MLTYIFGPKVEVHDGARADEAHTQEAPFYYYGAVAIYSMGVWP
jgi:hypothetical protein